MKIFDLFRKTKSSAPMNPMNVGNWESTRGDNRNIVGWAPSNGSADSDTLDDLPTLRSQARDLVRNSTIGGGAVTTSVTNSIGTGLKPQSRIMKSILGMENQTANEWQKNVENLFWLWADSKLCDVTKGQNFWELQRLIFRSKQESGDCFVLRRYLKRGNILGLTLQVVESDRICNPYLAPDTETIKGGIERDSNGAPTFYHICNRNPLDYSSASSVQVSWTKVSADSVVHVFERTRPDQSRGIPFLSGVVEQLKQLQRLSEAELTAAVVTSKMVMAVESDARDSASVLPGLLPGQVSTPSGITVNGSAPLAPAGTKIAKIASGTIIDMDPGEKITNLTPTRPNAAFSPFFEAIVRQVGVYLQIPYENLILYYSSSYTSARASQLDSKKTWDLNVEFMSHNFCNIIWGWFLEEAIASGLISAPGFFENPIVRMAYSMVQWSGPAMGSLNPSVEADADYKNMTMGVRTLQQITQEKGSDWSENLQQRSHELEMQWAMPYLVNPSMISSPIGPNGQIMNSGGSSSEPVKVTKESEAENAD